MWGFIGWIVFFVVSLLISVRIALKIHRNGTRRGKQKVYAVMVLWGLTAGLTLFLAQIMSPAPPSFRNDIGNSLVTLITGVVVFPIIGAIGTWRVYNRRQIDDVNRDIRSVFKRRK